MEERFSDSDVEYWKVEEGGVMKMVFRRPEICRDCFQSKCCFIMREGDNARCADCDAMRTVGA